MSRARTNDSNLKLGIFENLNGRMGGFSNKTNTLQICFWKLVTNFEYCVCVWTVELFLEDFGNNFALMSIFLHCYRNIHQ